MAWTAQKSKVATNKLRAFHPPTKDGMGVQANCICGKVWKQKNKHLQFAMLFVASLYLVSGEPSTHPPTKDGVGVQTANVEKYESKKSEKVLK